MKGLGFLCCSLQIVLADSQISQSVVVTCQLHDRLKRQKHNAGKRHKDTETASRVLRLLEESTECPICRRRFGIAL